MRLWLLRHGEAEPRARTDAERNLTEEAGVTCAAAPLSTRQAAAGSAGQPLPACTATADEVCKALGFSGRRETVDWATPESDLEEALRALDLRGERSAHGHAPALRRQRPVG